MTTSESKGRFFLQNESIRIDSNRELECSSIEYSCWAIEWGRLLTLTLTSFVRCEHDI